MSTTAPDATPDETVPEPVRDPNAVSITINGREVEARKGEFVIAAADRAGEYIPRFCYHPRMSSVGMCRQCLVEVEGPRGPMMVVSCMTPVAEGQVVHTDTPTVKRAHEGIIELLLANHPLDCPVCDKGGECPLQDQAFSHGPGESRFVEEKRHYEKPIPISDLVYLDRERCILCDRCTRFADEVAGDALIHFTQRGNNTQVLTFPDEPFSSYFSGNTVQICPVGALTAKPYRFKARPWDLDEVESTCTTCSVGCRVSVQASRDQVVRLQGIDDDDVNWGWLCDRGRFDFESIGSDQRLTVPLVRTESGLTETSWSAALAAAAGLLSDAISADGAQGVAVLGGARSTNEGAGAWAQLAAALGVDRLDAQLADGLDPLVFDLPQATIADASTAATVVLLGPDLKEELPVLYLRLRDAAVAARTRLVEVAPRGTGLSGLAWRSVLHEPGTQTAAVRSLLADPAVAAQLSAGPVVVVVGRANLAEDPAFTLDALRTVLAAAPGATVLPVLRRGNVRGAVAAGVGRTAQSAQILRDAADGRIGCLVLVGADPLADVPDTDLARRALAGARRVIAVDTFPTASVRQAHVVLPAAAFAETAGTTTNLEGRVSRVAQKVTVRGTARPDWMIATELAGALGHDLGIDSPATAERKLARSVPAFAEALAAAGTNGATVVLPSVGATDRLASVAPPAAPERNSYDYRLVVSRTLYDRATMTAMSPSLAPLAPAASLHMHPLDLDRLGAAEGTSVSVTSPTTTVVMTVTADPAVVRGTVWAGWNHDGANVGELLSLDAPVVDVRVESITSGSPEGGR